MYSTLIDNKNVSIYLFLDQNQSDVVINSANVEFQGQMIDGTLNNTNCSLVTNTVPPEDWIGRKYLYENGAYVANPNFTPT